MIDVEAGQRWQHWKGGTYSILSTGFIEATGEAAVVYRSEGTGVVWVRSLSNFLGKVKDDGSPSPSVDRFEKISEAPAPKPELKNRCPECGPTLYVIEINGSTFVCHAPNCSVGMVQDTNPTEKRP